jgi:hypothetical protein
VLSCKFAGWRRRRLTTSGDDGQWLARADDALRDRIAAVLAEAQRLEEQRQGAAQGGVAGGAMSGTTIHNERVKLLATALNNLGVGAIIAGFVTPMVRGEINGLASVLIWGVAIGLNLIIQAQVWLGRMR